MRSTWPALAPLALLALLALVASCAAPTARPVAAWQVTAVEVARLGARKFDHVDRLRAVAFTPDGALVAVTPDVLLVLDPVTGRERARAEDWKGADDVTFTPGAGLVGTRVAGGLWLHSPGPGGAVEIPLARPLTAYTLFALTSDGRTLAYTDDRLVRVVDVATGRELLTFPRPGSSRQLGFSPDGSRLALASYGEVHVHDATTGDVRLALTGDDGYGVFAWSPDGRVLATCWTPHGGSTLHLIDVASGQELSQPIALTGGDCIALAYSPDGGSLAAGLRCTAEVPRTLIVDARTGEVRPLGRGNDGEVSCVAFSADGALLATVDRGVGLWRVADGEDLTFGGHGDDVRAGAFSRDGEVLATGSLDAVCLWRASDGAPLARSPVGAAQLAPAEDGTFTALRPFTMNGVTADALDPATGAVLRSVAVAFEQPMSVTMAPGGAWVVLGSAGAMLARFDLATGRQAWAIDSFDVADDGGSIQGMAFSNGITALAVSPDGLRIAAGFFTGEVVIVDAATGRELHEFSVGRQVRAPLFALRFSPDGRTLMIETPGGTSLWDAEAGKLRVDLGDVARGATFSPDGALVAAHGPEQVTVLFEAATGAQAGTLPGGPRDRSDTLLFDPAGGRLVVGGRGTATVWSLGR